MKFFKLVWDIHKWIGVVAALFLLVISATGFLLLLKKKYEALQPVTQTDVAGSPEHYLPLAEVYRVAFAAGREELRSEKDIDRIDFRPKQRVFKVRSKHRNFELQVGAVSGKILSARRRWSDWIESLHDGQMIAGWFHDWWMPAVAIALFSLALTGAYIFVWPYLRRWRKRAHSGRRAGRGPAPAEGGADVPP